MSTFDALLVSTKAEPSAAFATQLQAANVKSYEVNKTTERDWTDAQREKGGLFGAGCSHDTFRTCERIEPTTGLKSNIPSYKVNVATNEKCTNIGTYNAQTLCVPLSKLQVLDTHGKRVPLLQHLEPAAAALAASYLQGNAGRKMVAKMGYTEAYNEVCQAGLKNLRHELGQYDKADMYADANLTVLSRDDTGELVYEYKIARDYFKHRRITIVCVDSGESTTWGVVDTRQDLSLIHI